jgi:hypothetical protein
MKKHKDAAAFIVEGYPRDKLQVEEFNKHVSSYKINNSVYTGEITLNIFILDNNHCK